MEGSGRDRLFGDEATNTTSYLSVLATYGLIKHHEVQQPMAKGGIGRWTHYFAIIRDKTSGQRWAIDSSMRVSGREPIFHGSRKVLREPVVTASRQV